MKTKLPKVLHPLAGRPLLSWAASLARRVGASRICAVVSSKTNAVGLAAAAELSAEAVMVQNPPQGTGDAVKCAQDAFAGFEGNVITLYADVPLIRAQTIERVFAAIEDGADIAVLGFEATDPGAYGRLVLSEDGSLEKITEAKDASSAELAIRLCNSGVLAAGSSLLFSLLGEITNDNANGEYYLTDIVGLAKQRDLRIVVVTADEDEVMGVNSQAELAIAENLFQTQVREKWMQNGVRLRAPETVFASWDTQIEPDCVIEPYVVFGPGVHLGAGTHVHSFSHLEGVMAKGDASIGPFARLRQGTNIAAEAKIGNFVETKNAEIGHGTKISHLSYIGDTNIGTQVNIGAGTITCNYDGVSKHITTIGAGAFIGSNTSLVAPITIGAGALVGSGSVITCNVPQNALSIARARQRDINDGATRFRNRKNKDA